MPSRKLPEADRLSVQQRLAHLASKLTALKAEEDAVKLAVQFEDLGNRFIDLSEWLMDPSLRVDDAGVVGRGRRSI